MKVTCCHSTAGRRRIALLFNGFLYSCRIAERPSVAFGREKGKARLVISRLLVSCACAKQIGNLWNQRKANDLDMN